MFSYPHFLLVLGLGLSSYALGIDRPVSVSPSDDDLQIDTVAPLPKKSARSNASQNANNLQRPINTSAKHVRLGIVPGEVPSLVQAQLAMNGYPGIAIESIDPNGPASKAGLKNLDIITQIGDTHLSGPSSLKDALAGYKPGDSVAVTYLRAGKEEQCEVVLDGSNLGDLPNDDSDDSLSGTSMFDKIGKAIGAGRHRFPINPSNSGNSTAPGLQPLPNFPSLPQQNSGSNLGDDVQNAMQTMRQMMQGFNGSDAFEYLNILSAMMDRGLSIHHSSGSSGIRIAPGTGNGITFSQSHSNGSNSVIRLHDSQGSIEMTSNPMDGTRVVVKDHNGKLLFEGPYTTQEDKANVPPEVRQRLERIQMGY
jgi:membrane-associated protease RseP (regulator of RpoE activity)